MCVCAFTHERASISETDVCDCFISFVCGHARYLFMGLRETDDSARSSLDRRVILQTTTTYLETRTHTHSPMYICIPSTIQPKLTCSCTSHRHHNTPVILHPSQQEVNLSCVDPSSQVLLLFLGKPQLCLKPCWNPTNNGRN